MRKPSNGQIKMKPLPKILAKPGPITKDVKQVLKTQMAELGAKPPKKPTLTIKREKTRK